MKGQLSNEYYLPMILLDYTQRAVHWQGTVITGLCIDYDDETLYWASPNDQTIYKNKYGEDIRKDNNNDYGTIEKLYAKRQETSWIMVMLFRFNDDIEHGLQQKQQWHLLVQCR